MKKGLFALVVLGAIAGTVAYKLKKNQEEKELLDEELEILSAVEEETEETEEENEDESEDPDEIEELFEEVETEESIEEETKETDEEVLEFDFSDKFDEVLEEIENNSIEENIPEEIVEEFIEEETEEMDEEVCEFDFSDKFEEVLEEIENHSIEEDISKEIVEENVEDYKIDLELDEEPETNNIFEDETPIQHTVDFKSIEDMNAYKAAVIEKGYVVTRGESPYQLSVLHIAPTNKSELLVNVYYLANQAMKHNGSYQGWQSRKVL